MLTHFPKAVPEIPVSNVEKAAEYYVNVLGFRFDWDNLDDNQLRVFYDFSSELPQESA